MNRDTHGNTTMWRAAHPLKRPHRMAYVRREQTASVSGRVSKEAAVLVAGRAELGPVIISRTPSIDQQVYRGHAGS